MVCVGGGGRGSENPGNMLTASFPGDEKKKNSWKVSAKDHEVPNPIFLKVWAIGIKIAGIKINELRDKIIYVHSDSSATNHPFADATIARPYSLLGGGFNVHYNGAGNICTASFPRTSYSWSAVSKDADNPDQSIITAYAIGITTNLVVGSTKIGRIITAYHTNDAISPPGKQPTGPVSALPSHPHQSSGPIDGFALTCGGGKAFWRVGQYLWDLEPMKDQRFMAQSKDHIHQDSETLTSYWIGVKLDPPSI